MDVLHIGFECYPAAKAGGLGDVIGTLPKYMNDSNGSMSVVMPHHDLPWFSGQAFEEVHYGMFAFGMDKVAYWVYRERDDVLGFPLYTVHIPELLHRRGIYIDPDSGHPFPDEFERFAGFQMAALDWLKSMDPVDKPDLIHCHDHHTALIPFLMTASPAYHEFAGTPSLLTVHNAEYQGRFDVGKKVLLPNLYAEKEGFLYWNGQLNALACGLRCCWQVSTVSPSYMDELRNESAGLERIFEQEIDKSTGILNGIDTEVWNPQTDTHLAQRYGKRNLRTGKKANKKDLCDQYDMNTKLPLFVFIGRMVHEKGADLLPDLIGHFLDSGNRAQFLVLGTGLPELHERFRRLEEEHPDYFRAVLAYDEALAHRLYGAADFLLMPSRVEPCGLNQMYAMRYATLPIVRRTGGLRDSVTDYSEADGYGICFDGLNLQEASSALLRALELYYNTAMMRRLQSRAISLDFSWHRSADRYRTLYRQLMKGG